MAKTREQLRRILERKPDVPDRRRVEAVLEAGPEAAPRRAPVVKRRDARRSEFPVSWHGMNQESQHNKHNDSGQSGHRPQQHTAAEQGED